MTPMHRWTLGALLMGAALAQGSSPLTLTLAQAIVTQTTVNGRTTETLTPAPKTVLPGTVLSQIVSARNTGTTALKSVVVNLPVPRSTVFLTTDPLPEGTKALYSIDGGKTFAAAPLTKRVTVMENGASVQKVVTVQPSEYTNARWTISSLAPGAVVKVGFRIKVR